MACDKSSSNKNKFWWKLQINVCKQPKVVEQFSEGPDRSSHRKSIVQVDKRRNCISWSSSDVFTIIPNRNTIWAKHTSNVDTKFNLDRLSTILIAEFEIIFDYRENPREHHLRNCIWRLNFVQDVNLTSYVSFIYVFWLLSYFYQCW